MADTPKNQALFPQASVQKPGCGFPVARILASLCLASGMILQWVSGHWYQHELSLLADLLEGFSPTFATGRVGREFSQQKLGFGVEGLHYIGFSFRASGRLGFGNGAGAGVAGATARSTGAVPGWARCSVT